MRSLSELKSITKIRLGKLEFLKETEVEEEDDDEDT